MRLVREGDVNVECDQQQTTKTERGVRHLNTFTTTFTNTSVSGIVFLL